MNKKYERYMIPIVLPIVLAIIWITLTENEIIAPYLIPSPLLVFETIFELLGDGTLLEDTKVSVNRMLQGFSLAVFFGLLFGVVMGLFTRVDRFFAGIFNAIRVIPPLAWIPIIILWFGIGERLKSLLFSRVPFSQFS